jgi:formiminotetrahydrofolate cyclodeaminase
MPAPSDPLARRPLDELLAELAAKTPAPGGGAAAAWSVALSAALTEMACAFTLARDAYRDRHARVRVIEARANELRRTALGLAQQDLRAFQAVLETARLPETDPDREQRLSAARSTAAQPPLEIARAGAEAADLAAELALAGNPNLLGDSATGTLLAEAGCRAAVTLVKINLREAPSDPRVGEAGVLAERALDARRRLPT